MVCVFGHPREFLFLHVTCVGLLFFCHFLFVNIATMFKYGCGLAWFLKFKSSHVQKLYINMHDCNTLLYSIINQVSSIKYI